MQISIPGKNNKVVMGFAGKAGAGKTFIAQKTIEQLKSQGLRIAIISYADPIKMLLRKFGISKQGPVEDTLPLPDPQIVYSMITEYFIEILEKRMPEWKGCKDKNDVFVTVGAKVHDYLDRFYIHLGQIVQNLNNKDEYNYHFRKIMTLTGTEIGRGISETIWIDDLVHTSLDLFGAGINAIFVDDVRFFNEYEDTQKKFTMEGVDMGVWGIKCSDQTRARRQKISVDAVIEHNKHSSEKQVDLILADLPKDRIIDNN